MEQSRLQLGPILDAGIASGGSTCCATAPAPSGKSLVGGTCTVAGTKSDSSPSRRESGGKKRQSGFPAGQRAAQCFRCCCVAVPGSESWPCSSLQLPAQEHPGSRQLMLRRLGPCRRGERPGPSSWLLASSWPGSGSLGSELASGSSLSLSLPFKTLSINDVLESL